LRTPNEIDKLHTRKYAIARRRSISKDNVARLLATERTRCPSKRLENMAITDRGLDNFNALSVHSKTESEIRHHCDNDSVAGQFTAFAKIARKQCNQLIAIYEFTAFIDRKKSIGVAIKREPKCSTACNYRTLQILGMR
jgi:hypothetical protein